VVRGSDPRLNRTSIPSCDHNIQYTSVYFDLFIGMEPFGVFRLLAKLHAVTQAFVLFHMERNVIFPYSVMHEKTSVYVSGTPNYL